MNFIINFGQVDISSKLRKIVLSKLTLKIKRKEEDNKINNENNKIKVVVDKIKEIEVIYFHLYVEKIKDILVFPYRGETS